MIRLFIFTIIYFQFFSAFAGPNYIINLDKSKSRLKKINEIFNKFDLEYQRIKAIYGYDIDITDIESGKKYSGLDLKKGILKFKAGKKYHIDCHDNPEANFIFEKSQKTDLKIDYQMSAGALGCFCSHRITLLDAIKNQYERFAIFEDDVRIISNDFPIILEKSKLLLPKNAVIYLGSYGKEAENILKNAISIGDYRIISNSRELYGTHAIIWDLGAAKLFMNKTNIVNFAIDNELARYIASGDIKGLLYSKKLVRGGKKSESIIKSMR